MAGIGQFSSKMKQVLCQCVKWSGGGRRSELRRGLGGHLRNALFRAVWECRAACIDLSSGVGASACSGWFWRWSARIFRDLGAIPATWPC